MDTRGWGKVLVLGGIVGLLASLAMDTSVETGMGSRVNNLGLMRDQQNYIMISLGAMIAGAIMLARRQSDQVTVSDGSRYQSDELKTCPDCAEQIKRDAKMCRFCGKRDLPEEPDTPFEPAYYEHRPKEKTLFEKLFWSSTDPKHPGNRK